MYAGVSATAVRPAVRLTGRATAAAMGARLALSGFGTRPRGGRLRGFRGARMRRVSAPSGPPESSDSSVDAALFMIAAIARKCSHRQHPVNLGRAGQAAARAGGILEAAKLSEFNRFP